jgi:hypothetical protein
MHVADRELEFATGTPAAVDSRGSLRQVIDSEERHRGHPAASGDVEVAGGFLAVPPAPLTSLTKNACWPEASVVVAVGGAVPGERARHRVHFPLPEGVEVAR